MHKEKHFPTILLITDKSSYPILFRHKLGELYHIYPAGAKDFAIPSNFSADLIIIDDAPFDKSIFNLITEFRKKREFHTTPIIVISGSLKKSYLDHLVKAGANDFFQTPLDVEEVASRLQDVNKYKDIQRKMDTVVGTISTTTQHTTDLKTRFLLNQSALAPIYTTLEKKGRLALFLGVIDREIPDDMNDTLTEAFRTLLKPSQFLIALGRGKFLFLLDHASIRQGLTVAKKIQELAHSHSLTISIGITSQKKPAYENIGEMIKDAKLALSQAKDAGDTIVVHRY